jgi:chemosensory pili system protein ChpA (sensor histidine kinase/response regulator)
MKLKDLIEAFASEIELARTRLDQDLDELATLEIENPAFMDALDQYSGQAQRMGEAAELAGFPGLQLVCAHVMENSLMLAAQPPGERAAMLAFLRAWPPMIVHYLRNLSDPSTAAGLIDLLRGAPIPMGEDQALKVMHMLGAMPLQVGMPGDGDGQSHRQVLAAPEDVALVMPGDVDRNFLEGFFQEAPEQARHLVRLARNMVAGEGDSSDIIAAKRVAHTLKGSGATIGLRGIASLGHHLEDILDYFEREDSQVPAQVANALLDAAYCLEQMIGYVTGSDEYPQQSQVVLQTVLDVANRIDAGESLDQPATRVGSPVPASAAPAPAAALADTDSAGAAARKGAADAPGSEAAPGSAAASALRVSLRRIEDMFLVSGEISVNSSAMEAGIKGLVESSRELLAQNLRVQKRLFELETVLQMRTLSKARSRSQHSGGAEFDPLEMDQYNELHSTSHALTEEAADARTMASRVEEGIAQIAAQQTRQRRLSNDLQHLVIGTRMTEVGVLESRLQRNVRSTCQVTGKDAVLVLEGGDTLIDSDLLNKLAEPLLHLLRNAVDHGMETPGERAAAGKPRTGRILLSFARQGQQVVLRCQDDGRGLDLRAIQRRAIERGLLSEEQALSDAEIQRMVLLPGFSTRHSVSEVSGRGIGLDVVRDWVTAMNGSIQIASKPGQGCTFELRFAASLSTMQSLIVEVAGERLAMPSVQIEQAVSRGVGEFKLIGDRLVYNFNKHTYPAMRLADMAGLGDVSKPLDGYSAVLVKLNDKIQALAVDRLLDARELLVNNPGRYARHLRGVAGLSILGDGAIAVNLDLAQLFAGGARATTANSVARKEEQQVNLPGVLIVDDSLSVRNSLVQLMRDAGYRAETARDGIDAIDTLSTFKPDVVLTDLEMPNMNGVELTYHLREREDMKGMPIIMITSRSQDKHRRMAEQAGVDTYITKPYNDGELLQTIRRTIAHEQRAGA